MEAPQFKEIRRSYGFRPWSVKDRKSIGATLIARSQFQVQNRPDDKGKWSVA